MSTNKRVRIFNDAQPSYMTTITDTETGEEIPGVTHIDITLDVKDPVPTAVITTVVPVVDVIADAEIKKVCPCCGQPVEQE